MMNRHVALVTCRDYPDLDDDERTVIAALADEGVTARPEAWDDETVDWSRYGLAVVRSTWDYVDRRGEFLAWVESVPRLANPAAALRWNTDKRYLRDLAAAGVRTVPTTWLEPGDDVVLPAAGAHVVKPSVGNGSKDAGRFDLGEPAERDLAAKHVRRLLDRGATAMVQPYLDAVDTAGETALVYVGGAFSHALRKEPLLSGPDTAVDGLFRPERISAALPTAAERAVADEVLAAAREIVGADLLYARVDLLPDASGRPALLELEAAEPSLFLTHWDGAAGRFAAAIGTHLDRVLRTG